MTFWAMAAVELIYPLVVQMTAEGHFEDCPFCQHALSWLMRANLLLFQTVIAGDSWGRLATPVIEAYPWTAIIFMGSQLMVVFGVQNLVVAVVVDTFAVQRQKDVVEFAQEMDADQDDDKKFLRRIFTKIDEDGSGDLSFKELMHGARTVPEFQSRSRVMDIDEGDLTQLFQMLDGDDSGTVEPEEFINAISRWMHDSKTANRFVKYNVMGTMIQQEELRDLLVDKIDKLGTNLRQPSPPQFDKIDKLETKTGVKKEKHIPKQGPKQGQLSVGPDAGGASLGRPPRSLEESVMIATERGHFVQPQTPLKTACWRRLSRRSRGRSRRCGRRCWMCRSRCTTYPMQANWWAQVPEPQVDLQPWRQQHLTSLPCLPVSLGCSPQRSW
ncbi:unnamed protein product [Polarella glacialis]|uniref:EF-hand domain-containing protein n=1 Tax=Polarella glacialis TaxID=89957 RepID=A0A813FC71_POLGL|nr:unnamed protein product [Polarella glacialis]